jgi:rsbT co-antagonist protein RsbR
MAKPAKQAASTLVEAHHDEIERQWLELLQGAGALRSGRMREGELQRQCRDFLSRLREALKRDSSDTDSAAFGEVRGLLTEVSSSRAIQGYSPRETASFVLSLKQPLFDVIQQHAGSDAGTFEVIWGLGQVLDRLSLFTMEAYQKTRETLIVRQQQEIAELSTPVIKLWDGILALPMIGTLDSQRTQVVMENLLESIVQQNAEIAIIDITGVPTVDTLTAQYLLKTVAAARLMGADCIISGIRPQIAQTIVHLGVELTVVSKATLADAFALALSRQGRTVVKQRNGSTPAGA